MEDTIVLNIDKICRACLLEKFEMRTLFDEQTADMFAFCTSVSATINDELPMLLCTECSQLINQSYVFKQQCIRSNEILRQYISELKSQEKESTKEFITNDNSDNLNISDNERIVSKKTRSSKLATAKKLKNGENNFAFSCKVCGEGFELIEDLDIHLICHPKDDKIVCTLCRKEFVDVKVLKRHVRIHMKNKPLNFNAVGSWIRDFSVEQFNEDPWRSCTTSITVYQGDIVARKFRRFTVRKTGISEQDTDASYCDHCDHYTSFLLSANKFELVNIYSLLKKVIIFSSERPEFHINISGSEYLSSLEAENRKCARMNSFAMGSFLEHSTSPNFNQSVYALFKTENTPDTVQTVHDLICERAKME
ncbi:uncharacterized protein CBL_20460 [Carabus blaptoides fortunei]